MDLFGCDTLVYIYIFEMFFQYTVFGVFVPMLLL